MTAKQRRQQEHHDSPIIRAIRKSIRNWVLGSSVGLMIGGIWISRGLYDEIKNSTSTNTKQDVEIKILQDSTKEHGEWIWARVKSDTLYIANLPAKPAHKSLFGPSVTNELP